MMLSCLIELEMTGQHFEYEFYTSNGQFNSIQVVALEQQTKYDN